MAIRLLGVLALVLVFLLILIPRLPDGSEGDPLLDASSEQGSEAEQQGGPSAPGNGDSNGEQEAGGSAQPGSSRPSSLPETPDAPDDEPDWTQVSDVDELKAELEAQFDEGDAQAALHLSTLKNLCYAAAVNKERLIARFDDTHDPEERQPLASYLEKLEQLQGPCEDADAISSPPALSDVEKWTWRAAEAGEESAMYSVVFNQHGDPPDELMDDDEEQHALRQSFLQELRDQCHADSLQSIGLHMAAGSRVTEDFSLGVEADVPEETARQMEAFGHRYAAASLRGQDEPAAKARHADHPLTPAEERQAQQFGQRLLANCD